MRGARPTGPPVVAARVREHLAPPPGRVRPHRRTGRRVVEHPRRRRRPRWAGAAPASRRRLPPGARRALRPAAAGGVSRRAGGAARGARHAPSRGDAAAPPAHPRRGIVDDARRLGLALYYSPSMRNGAPAETDEDRGNAILSTEPLSDLAAIELPFERQRRVAAAATVHAARPGDGQPRAIRARQRAPREHRVGPPAAGARPGTAAPPGAGAARVMPPDAPLLVGGDFNTWFGYPDRTYKAMAAAVPDIGGRRPPADLRPVAPARSRVLAPARRLDRHGDAAGRALRLGPLPDSGSRARPAARSLDAGTDRRRTADCGGAVVAPGDWTAAYNGAPHAPSVRHAPRRLRDRRAARRRRHGRGLPGPRYAPPARRRPEDPAAADGRRCRCASPASSARRRPWPRCRTRTSWPSTTSAGPTRASYVVVRAARGRDAARAARGRAAAGAQGHRLRAAGRRRPGRGARPGHRPPRHQARQPLRHRRRPGEDSRLRPGADGARRGRAHRDESTITQAPITDAGTVLGTVGYMAPEQVRGQPVDAPRRPLRPRLRALRDVHRPARRSRATTPADTMTAVLTRTRRSSRWPGKPTPPALDRIVRRCLEKQPDRALPVGPRPRRSRSTRCRRCRARRATAPVGTTPAGGGGSCRRRAGRPRGSARPGRVAWPASPLGDRVRPAPAMEFPAPSAARASSF